MKNIKKRFSRQWRSWIKKTEPEEQPSMSEEEAKTIINRQLNDTIKKQQKRVAFTPRIK